jgi:hypothetical protein
LIFAPSEKDAVFTEPVRLDIPGRTRFGQHVTEATILEASFPAGRGQVCSVGSCVGKKARQIPDRSIRPAPDTHQGACCQGHGEDHLGLACSDERASQGEPPNPKSPSVANNGYQRRAVYWVAADGIEVDATDPGQ